MLCAKCAGRMETVAIAGQKVDRCTVCKGLWLDLGEVAASPAAVAAVDTGAARPVLAARRDTVCPRCRSALASVTDPDHGVRYEKCGVCQGVFLDAGEWKKLNPGSLGQWLRRLLPG